MGTIFERLTEAQNSHDADTFASYFADDYRSEQPAHPGRAFSGRAQVLVNWSAVFAGVPDFEAGSGVLLAGDVEWGEFDWRGHHTDGSKFCMRGVIIATIRDDRIAEARLVRRAAVADRIGHRGCGRGSTYRPPHQQP